MSEEKEVSIYEALINARKGFKPVKKDALNPFFKKKYASLESVIEAVKESLLENGLWFKFDEDPIDLSKVITTSKETINKDGSKTVVQTSVLINTVKTIIYNKATKETIVTPHNYAVEEMTSQGFGKASTYAQRYGLSAALGIVSEDDEDGNTKKQQQSAQQQTQAKPAQQAKPAASAKPAETKTAQPKSKTLTLEEIKNIEGVAVTEDDDVVTVGGKTFLLANDLRGLGFSWNGQTKSWFKKTQAAAIAAA